MKFVLHTMKFHLYTVKIRGLSIDEAIRQLAFRRDKGSHIVKEVPSFLLSAFFSLLYVFANLSIIKELCNFEYIDSPGSSTYGS